jgi:nicotinate phosphoribosyltransferase
MLASKLYGIPIYGTMAHSFVQAHDSEVDAFEAFARSRPENLVLLIDTYDTENGARKVVSLAQRLKAASIAIRGVRLDSGDLLALSKSVRRILDDGGLKQTTIFASGGIDEEELARFTAAKAPIDGFGIGTALTTSFDLPALDCAYKLQEYAGLPRRKRSTGKATWPGRKQVWRQYGADARMRQDILAAEQESEPGEPLIEAVMKNGRRLRPPPMLADIRARLLRGLEQLPEPIRRLRPEVSYPVQVSEGLLRLAAEVDQRLAQREGTRL